MQEQIKDLIDAIASNDTATSLSTFNSIVGEKVAVALDNYKTQVASTMFNHKE